MKMTKNKVIIALFILTVIAVTGYAQVNQEELQNLPPVEFINYVGPHTQVNTREEIRQIGVSLGQQKAAAQGLAAAVLDQMTAEERRQYSYTVEAGVTNRYFVIHCVSGPEDNKLDADIFGLGVDAGVDHIRNLRVIIQGYLQAAYNYSERDAALLANFITIYNAVYRGNWDYFSNRYKTLVMENLTSDKAGLSIRYDEWPGRTLIVIPLGHGGLSSVDTSVISDERVIEEIRRDDDQGIQMRQDLVDLMEREADEAEQQAQVEREQIREDERQLEEDRRQTEQDRRQVEQERQQTEQDRRQVEQERQQIDQERRQTQEDQRVTEQERRQTQEDLDRREQQTQEREQEITQREQEIQEREQEVQDKEDELAQREDELEQRREDVERLEEFAEQKMDDAQDHRDEIARDQQDAIIQGDRDETEGDIGVAIERTSPAIMGRLVRFNPADGREIRKSPFDTVHVRTITFIDGKIIAIAGEARGQGAVRLVEINENGMEMAKQGDDDIKNGSLIWVNGRDLYAITVEDDNCYLGRFNTDLVLQARSIITVHPDAAVLVQQGRILTQRANGSPLALNLSDLTEYRISE
ncbi:MAG: hypothetical protein FWD13_05470 [Treponema sp.]|nr:hypothetical protein [Treponema sp.]